MRQHDYTPAEIAEAHDCNESFRGTRASLEKVRLYQTVKSDLEKFMELCSDVQAVDGFAPNVREKHAILWIDLMPAAILNKGETAALAAVMCKADGTVISAVDGHTRITFDICNVWER